VSVVPIMEPLLTVPFVGVQEFRTSPTWLDTNDLVEGGLDSAQDAELYNSLLKASRWAENFCDQPLRAHLIEENLRCRVNRMGRAYIHPGNNPVRNVLGLAYGPDPQLMTVMTNPTFWVEDQRGIVVSLIPMAGNFSSLQFGSVPSPMTETYITIQYIAGYANTYLTAPATIAATSLTVADPTGFIPPTTSIFGNQIGASIARIWDPALEEAVTIAGSYTPGANPLQLASGLANAHAAGAQVSEFPAELRTAVTALAVALLLRDDAGDEGPYPGSPGPTARRSESGGLAGGLIEEGERLLMPYRRSR
jgi:hypothetical protein